jgi:hypothetical protein
MEICTFDLSPQMKETELAALVHWITGPILFNVSGSCERAVAHKARRQSSGNTIRLIERVSAGIAN